MKSRKASGFTMLEVLITLVVISIGLLGLAGLQIFALKNTQDAGFRVTATLLANDMIDRMKANYEGVIFDHYNRSSAADYTTQVAACVTTPSATATGCTASDFAQNDRFEWAQRVAASLPGGQAVVCVTSTPNAGTDSSAPACDNVGTTAYAIKIWWVADRTQANPGGTRSLFFTTFNP
jgi:type IV pilus assembly protein PilV